MTRKLQAGSGHANHRFREPNGRPADNSRNALLEVHGHDRRVAVGYACVNHGGSSENCGKALPSLNPAFTSSCRPCLRLLRHAER